MQAPDELAFSQELFPEHASDAAAFSDFGLLRAPSVMAHCVHMQPGEVELLRRHGASVAHCPLSNFFFAKEALPVRQLMAAGVSVGLGTDVAGGYSPSMLDAMRHAVLASKTLQFRRAANCVFGCEAPPPPQQPGRRATKRARTASGSFASAFAPSHDEDTRRTLHNLSHLDALHLATQSGADALGLGASIGSFDVGKVFDAIVLTASPPAIRPYADGVAEDAYDVLHKLITRGDDRNVAERR